MNPREPDTKSPAFAAFQPHFAKVLQEHGYLLALEIGAGGQAVVYRCQCIRDGEDYAVKITEAGDEKAVPAELEALQSVWNPHVINVYDSFVAGGFRFMVLEYCPGGSLLDHLRAAPIPMDQLWRLGRQIIEALIACHSHGVAHLDVKPQNILIDKFGRAKLCDFGLAWRKGCGAVSNQFKGSVAFVAPEILRKVDHDPLKADVWSVGVTLYVCATGRLPWPTTVKEFLAGVAKGLGETDDSVPSDFEQILRRMIVPDPNARASLTEIAQEFVAKCNRNAPPERARNSILALHNWGRSTHLRRLRLLPDGQGDKSPIPHRRSDIGLDGANGRRIGSLLLNPSVLNALRDGRGRRGSGSALLK
jgi:serine/threonine protein kinase